MVVKKGIIGYQITSIPYERISDIIISRSFLENFFGIASLHLQTLAGQISSGRFGSEGQLLAVPDPEELQSKILKLAKEKRKKEKLTF
ncbi:MAG: PH domain-containing protein [Candidatus Aenigmarchaeota archaeon]|nr:PH domain-containing protein [Candidatus Aenigmarchaeota archaeon]